MLDVWDEFMVLQRRMDDLFRTYLGPRARATFPALPEGFRRPFMPVCDVFGREGDLIVHLEVPGIDPEKDVTIQVEDDVLVIRGERSTKEEVEDKDYYRMESSFGSFERRLPIPEGVKEDDIVATYADGVLEIVLPGAAPKIEEPVEEKHEVKTIPIKAA
ncbi:MAG TPA: Hsp20/alpha crystallin family protein [Actinomycetota bacterium]|nr:Hsp20/alpha crystallin family protein [Actinomycetota bacterium]